jgi:streptogramin lyase
LLGSVLLAAAMLPVGLAHAEGVERIPVAELNITATTHLGKTADWVAIAPDAVWVGSTGPFAVHRIDPISGKRLATVPLRGEPCAGLALGFGSLWVPLCGPKPGLAKVDVLTNTLTGTFDVAPAAAEGGITTSDDSVWMVVGKDRTLARIDPQSGFTRQTLRIPPGSFNPRYHDGAIWITRADAAEVTILDIGSGKLSTVATGPGPRFLTEGGGSIWTLNQGDGSLTRIDTAPDHSAKTVPLGTPGPGGDIAFGEGTIWTTVPKVPLAATDASSGALRCQWVGAGGDSLGVGHGAIWLTNYHAGTISKIDLLSTLRRCHLR